MILYMTPTVVYKGDVALLFIFRLTRTRRIILVINAIEYAKIQYLKRNFHAPRTYLANHKQKLGMKFLRYITY